MIYAFLIFIAIGIAVFYLVNNGFMQKKTLVADVVEVIDGRTLEVSVEGARLRVILAGVGFPPGDEKVLVDSEELVSEVARGKRLYMTIHKEIEGLNYVEFKSSNGDSLNELVLSRGLGRYEPRSIGFFGEMVTAEKSAKDKGIGIWDPNRDLFKHMTGEFTQEDELLSDASMLDTYESEDEETARL